LSSFSLFINSTDYYVVNSATSSYFISTSNPVTMVVIYKSAITNYYGDATYTDASGEEITKYAYHYYNAALATAISAASSNTVTAWYSNNSSITTVNTATASFDKFTESGSPSAPQSLNLTSSTSSTMAVSYTQPQYADSTNQGEGTISSYTVKYDSSGSYLRYPSAITFTSTDVSGITTTTTTK
jgi:hypothetical protein